MTNTQLLTSMAVVFLVMAVISVVETVVPLRARDVAGSRARTATNLAMTVLLFAANVLLSSATAAAVLALDLRGGGLLAVLGLPLSVRIVVGVALLDLCTYAAHRLMHALPFLWRFHRVHHSDPLVDVTTSFRMHPAEGLWRHLWIALPAIALGVPAEGLIAYRLISALNALLEHANVPVWPPLDRLLSLIWVTPDMHKVHHSAEPREADTNYGNILSIYDRVLRTFTPSERAFHVTYGLAGTRAGSGVRRLLSMPFAR